MVAMSPRPDTTDPGGYGSAAYAAALAHLGSPLHLPHAGAWVLRRAIGAGHEQDLVGPYPVLACARWSELERDLAELAGYVSLTAVIDPLAEVDAALLRRCFPDHLIEWKRHYLVDLAQDFVAARSSHHRRSVRRAHGALEVQRAQDPSAHWEEWVGLYSDLGQRVGLRGAASDFSASSLAAQLALPDMRYYRAQLGGQTVAACLWLRQGERIYYHLGASRSEGREQKASYALFDRALADAALEGLRWASLGGVAGLAEDPADGLAFFKRGWSTDSRVAWLAGNVLDRDAYAELSGTGLSGAGSAYFPAYRAGGVR